MQRCFVYSGNQGNTVSLLFISAALLCYSGNQGNTVSLLFISAALLCLQRKQRNTVSLLFISAALLCLLRKPKKHCIIAVHTCSAVLFTAETKETLYHCCSYVQHCFVYIGNKGTFKAPPAGRDWICISFCFHFMQIFFMYKVVSQNWSQNVLFLLQIRNDSNLC